MIPEQQLWQAVIVQAMTDALGNGRLTSAMSGPEKDSAINFFESSGEWASSFAGICLAAGYEPDYIRAGYNKAKKSGIKSFVSLRKLAAEQCPQYRANRKKKRL